MTVIRGDEFAQLLQSQELWPVDPSVEQDWSGRGQHVTFQKHEQRLIDEILEVQDILGSTRTAVVQSVKCRRILLARKSITCGNRTMTKEEAIAEVAHLTRLSHAHIIRVIGTYVKGRELSILLYPVANSNLEVFLETLRTACMGNNYKSRDIFAVETFPGCLSSAVSYLHRKLTKHMDIKPQNILVVKTSAESCKRPLLADFGIARTYRSAEETETNGWTSFTKRYAAPEVVKQDFRGLPADIFSLGCIFLEILDTIDCIYSIDVPPSWLQAILRANLQSDTSYQGNIDALQNHLTSRHTPARHLTSIGKHVSVISMMLNLDPRSRPTAEDLVSTFGEKHCCKSGAIQLKRDLTFHSHGRISDHHDRYCGSFDNQTESITWYYC
jgi:serine/threonine protein kinase